MKRFVSALLICVFAMNASAHAIQCNYGNSGIGGLTNPTLFMSVWASAAERVFFFQLTGYLGSAYFPKCNLSTGYRCAPEVPNSYSGYLLPVNYAFRNKYLTTQWTARFTSAAGVLWFSPFGYYAFTVIPGATLSCDVTGYVSRIYAS